MAEAGVDISGQRSEHVDRYLDAGIETVVTVCDGARESCPVFPGEAVAMHAGFDDPPALAAGAGTEQEKLEIYRRVRDRIREYVERLPALLLEGENR
jgi:arsenate reductase